jgi:murein DD-endopeptidase MepM/ murein hydrolase activator NlpD
MPGQRPHPIRVHGVRAVVVTLLLAVLVSPALPVGAQVPPVDPVPVGVWPLQPQPAVVRAFDPPSDPWGAGHRGVDLAGRTGSPVRAALAGRILFAGAIAGREVVSIDHGATRTTYEPVLATVRVGDRVARGQPVGTLELSGSHCLPAACLHWGWIRGTTYLDPLLLVGGGPVRLLPLWRVLVPTGMPVPTPPLPWALVPSRSAERSRSMKHTAAASPHADDPGREVGRPVPVRSFAMRPLLL